MWDSANATADGEWQMAKLTKTRVYARKTKFARLYYGVLFFGTQTAVKSAMNGKKILLVDDSQIELRTLSLKLTTNGYSVLRAIDGGEAVSIARREKPDLILLDISFPPDVGHGGGVPWDGFLIMAWLRRMDEAKNIPVIFISGQDAAKNKPRALAAKAQSSRASVR